jgi:rubrerythrin
MGETMTAKLIGASVWEEELYEYLTAHVANEHDLITSYQQAAIDSESPAFRYLAELIIEDEVRHHRMFTEIANALRSDAEFRPVEPRVPRLARLGPDRQRVIELTDELLDQERRDSQELHRVAKRLRDVKETTLWHLLVRLMEADTDKHIRILEFIKEHAA